MSFPSSVEIYIRFSYEISLCVLNVSFHQEHIRYLQMSQTSVEDRITNRYNRGAFKNDQPLFFYVKTNAGEQNYLDSR